MALVIGNSAYSLAPLTNPENDADDFSSALRRLRFDVTERKDLTIRAFDDAIDRFVEQAKDADVAMFFFSGHGVQIDKRGYLAPVDVKAETESSALRELISIQEVVSRVEKSAKVSVIVLDACRDSPLQERMRGIAVGKSRSLVTEAGLPTLSVIGSNTLVVYATVPGKTASDGAGRNSPFAAALLRHIETPGLDLELVFKRVTADVLDVTGGKQQPERLSRLQSELILRGDRPENQSRLDEDERRLWDAVKESADPAIIATYLNQYPTGRFASVARGQINYIERKHQLEEALAEEKKRQEEAKKGEAEIHRLEEELKARANVPGEEKVFSDEAKLSGKKEQAERVNRIEEELRKAKEEARIAREAATAAEEERKKAEKSVPKKPEKILGDRHQKRETHNASPAQPSGHVCLGNWLKCAERNAKRNGY